MEKKNTDNLTDMQQKTCPLCGCVLKWSNTSLNKLEGRRVCGDCSLKLHNAFPDRLSYKDVTIAQAQKQIQTYNENMKNYVPAVEEPKAKRIPRKAKCPKCHGTNIEPIGQKQKNFSVGKAVVGSAVVNPGIGLVTGMFGGSSRKIQFYCHDCGKIFKR